MKYQFVLSVWGERHIGLFLDLALPALMTPGNLLGFAGSGSELDIYTTADSKETLLRSPIMAAVQRYVDVRLTVMDGADSGDDMKYERMNAGHQMAAARSALIGSVIVFLSPDAIFADGTLAYSRKHIELGKRAIMLPTARGAAAPLIAQLRQLTDPHDPAVILVSPRQLATLLLAHPHDSEQFLRWGNSPFSEWPSRVMFPVPGEGYVLRALHNHPMAVHPSDRTHLPTSTMDAQWLVDVVPNLDDWHLITDTDDAFAIDIGTQPGLVNRLDVISCEELSLARWIVKHGDAGHRWMLGQNIRVHNGSQSQKWIDTEAAVTRLFRRIFDLTREIVA